MKIAGLAAVVTGGASGLGAATSAALAARGASVYGLDLPGSLAGAPVVDGVTYLGVDITDVAAVRAAMATVAESADPLRVLVNCAGVRSRSRLLGAGGVVDVEGFSRVVAVNLCGSFNAMALAAEVIARTTPSPEGQRGVIINTSSIAAFDGQIGHAAYAAAKGGIVSLTLPAARDLADVGIRVCCIAPGVVDTPMIGSIDDAARARATVDIPFPKRFARADEFASLALSVIEHDYLNGTTIRMDAALRMGSR